MTMEQNNETMSASLSPIVGDAAFAHKSWMHVSALK
jgi:hypothetical protein